MRQVLKTYFIYKDKKNTLNLNSYFFPIIIAVTLQLSMFVCPSDLLSFYLDQHQCYYSVMENHHESGLQYTEVCQNEEKLCIVVSKEEDGYEYR